MEAGCSEVGADGAVFDGALRSRSDAVCHHPIPRPFVGSHAILLHPPRGEGET